VNQGLLLLACAVLAALIFVPRVRTVLVVVGAALAVAVILGHVALTAGPVAVHHLAAWWGAR
jgi:hypothetical protein